LLHSGCRIEGMTVLGPNGAVGSRLTCAAIEGAAGTEACLRRANHGAGKRQAVGHVHGGR
jgi:hypothetical protein